MRKSQKLNEDQIYSNFLEILNAANQNLVDLKSEKFKEMWVEYILLLFILCKFLFSSIDYFQVVDLINYQGVFEHQNISSPIDNFFNLLSDFKKYPDHHFNLIFWQNTFAIWRAEILTKFGFCYTFNIVEDSTLLNLDEISSDFHYKHKITTSKHTKPTEFMSPLRTNHKSLGAFHFLDQYAKEFQGRNVSWILNDYDGFLILIHDPHELPNENSVKIYASISESVDVLVTPEITKTDESLYGLELKE